MTKKFFLYSIISMSLLFSGCATLFGWNIYAPGILSQSFYHSVKPCQQRIALYIPEEVQHYTSQNKGGRFADPQTYYIGEAFAPMILEAFQYAFDGLIFLEVNPTPEILQTYQISYLVSLDITQFSNMVTLKGQDVQLTTNVWLFNDTIDVLAQFEAQGRSDAKRVFAKKGGPEVNLNAALENNIYAMITFLQDFLEEKRNDKRNSV